MKEEKLFLKITDKGALMGISSTTQTLIQLSVLHQIDKPKTVKDLVKILIREQQKYLHWIEKKEKLDETISELNFTSNQIKNLLKSGKEAIKMAQKVWKIKTNLK